MANTMGDAEAIGLAILSFGFLAAILMALAESRAYPIALAIMLLVLLSIALDSSGAIQLWDKIVHSAANRVAGTGSR